MFKPALQGKVCFPWRGKDLAGQKVSAVTGTVSMATVISDYKKWQLSKNTENKGLYGCICFLRKLLWSVMWILQQSCEMLHFDVFLCFLAQIQLRFHEGVFTYNGSKTFVDFLCISTSQEPVEVWRKMLFKQ